ncbi:putative ion channel [Trichodelitschia bisporula]|uniref:Putative ion channel n=1 Tax=Trichodelitschia bisporula TaxID=703511 RepID=A0A6G1HTX9_9PEZI|nr:putative ion channel [Trichodelitschia bisporula]
MADVSHSSLEEYGNEFAARARATFDSFTDFALRDNVLEVAVGLILAAAFSAVANSLVTDILLPVVSLIPWINRNLDERFAVMRPGPQYRYPNGTVVGYNTRAQALEDGALIWAWGAFLDAVLRFLLIAASLFAIARIYGYVADDNIIKKQVRCKECRKYISEKARRCFNCTSWQDGREDVKPRGGGGQGEDLLS